MSANVGVVRGGLGGSLVSNMLAAFRGWREREREVARITRELETYSDRELSDLGLTRGDIPDVARGRFPGV